MGRLPRQRRASRSTDASETFPPIRIIGEIRRSMAGPSRILSMATLIAQLMLGCCLPHAHGCETELCFSAVHCDTTLHGQCLHCRCDQSHHGTQDCRGGKCSFVSPRRTIGGSLVPSFQASFAALLDDRLSRGATGLQQQLGGTGRLMLPVRLHLANQVLLI